jgi:hypothetical protein
MTDADRRAGSCCSAAPPTEQASRWSWRCFQGLSLATSSRDMPIKLAWSMGAVDAIGSSPGFPAGLSQSQSGLTLSLSQVSSSGPPPSNGAMPSDLRAAAAAREARLSSNLEGAAPAVRLGNKEAAPVVPPLDKIPAPPQDKKPPGQSPRDKKPVTPRDVVANSAPVHLDDALAKRVKAAMVKRPAVLQACPEAGPAYACLQEFADALAGSRGAVATMRANYQELYEICESWHEKALALESAAEGNAGAPAREREYAATLAAAEAFQKKQRLQLESCQNMLQTAERAAREAAAKEKAATEQAASAKKQLAAAAEDRDTAQAMRAQEARAAQLAAAEGEKERERLAAELAKLGASYKEKLQAAEARAKQLEERLGEHDVAAVRRAVSERELAAAAAQMRAASETRAQEQARQVEILTVELKLKQEQVSHLEQSLRAAKDAASDERAKHAAAQEQAAARLAAVAPERDAAVASAAAATKRANELEASLREAEAEREALQLKFLSTPAPAPAPAAAPPPPPPPGPTKVEMDFRALKGEVEGWKMVAENGEMTKERLERELKAANRTIATLRKDALEAADKENGAGTKPSVPIR